MTEAEKSLFGKMLHEFFDEDLPAILEIEQARLPAEYQGMVRMMAGMLIPVLIKAIDAKIDSLLTEGK